MKWETVFFDFDGVIVDSADIKTIAFAQMFSNYGDELKKKIVQYHLEHEGISRFEKFRYFYEALLLRNITEEELKNLGNIFSEIVLKKVIAAPFVEGAIESLEKLKLHHITSYIVSGTPHSEINYIVHQRKLTQYFTGVYGSPKQKHEIINDILRLNNYRASQCLLIGDAISDYNAACKTGVCFLGILKRNALSPFPPGTNLSSVVICEF
jgi:HAD superfamily hydrolase (TIGR01549 family)